MNFDFFFFYQTFIQLFISHIQYNNIYTAFSNYRDDMVIIYNYKTVFRIDGNDNGDSVLKKKMKKKIPKQYF